MYQLTSGRAHQIAVTLIEALRAGEPGASVWLDPEDETSDRATFGYLVGVPSTEIPDLNLDYEHVASVLGSWIQATYQTLTSQGLGIDGLATAGVWTDDDGRHVFNLSTWHLTEANADLVTHERGETASWNIADGEERRPRDLSI